MTDPETPGHSPDVVVGYDGSSTAGAAVAWAAGEAELLGVGLRVITGVAYPALAAGPYAAPLIEDLNVQAKTISQEGGRIAAKSLTAADITTQTVIGSVVGALVDASRTASVVVVGTRGRGAATSALLGSVSFAVTAHAHCTVVVVPEPEQDRSHQGPVVVGVDDSTSTGLAVDYAGGYAARHGRDLVVLAAWQQPMGPGLQEASWGRPAPEWSERAKKQAQQHAAAAADVVRRRHPGLTVDVKVVEGPAGTALSGASRTAALVVVGTRGLGGFKRLLLGSVSRAALHRPECPVTVARGVKILAEPTTRPGPADHAGVPDKQFQRWMDDGGALTPQN